MVPAVSASPREAKDVCNREQRGMWPSPGGLPSSSCPSELSPSLAPTYIALHLESVCICILLADVFSSIVEMRALWSQEVM